MKCETVSAVPLRGILGNVKIQNGNARNKEAQHSIMMNGCCFEEKRPLVWKGKGNIITLPHRKCLQLKTGGFVIGSVG